MRQVVLDTETTGLEVRQGHRLIEIACIEMVERRVTGKRYQTYLNPDRAIDEGARQVTGIEDEFLLDKPRFAEVAAEFLAFIDGAELIIHNAAFDLGFLNAELAKAWPVITEHKDGLADAKDWEGKPDKLKLLER